MHAIRNPFSKLHFAWMKCIAPGKKIQTNKRTKERNGFRTILSVFHFYSMNFDVFLPLYCCYYYWNWRMLILLPLLPLNFYNGFRFENVSPSLHIIFSCCAFHVCSLQTFLCHSQSSKEEKNTNEHTLLLILPGF